MSARISEVSIPRNGSWKIINDASESQLMDAAMGIVEDGGDGGILARKLNSSERETRELESRTVVNLATNESLASGVWKIAPVAQIHEMTVIDRDEIEAYRYLELLLTEHERSSSNKPLSIAVFGPPGSGKSFGVKMVLASKGFTSPLEFNLAQFSTPEQLADAFLQISSAGIGGKTPVAFFDEFDSSLGNTRLGWLRYFLAPMQDGEIFYHQTRHKIGKAVLVFAGGTSETFSQFTRETDSEEELAVFTHAKGPDWVSRLGGYIDVLGVNRRNVNDQSYILRRAIIFRAELVRKGLVGRSSRSLIDRAFVRKMLEIGEFKHGARSLSKVIDMCVGPDGALHIPPKEQLTMHIAADDVERLLRF